MNPHQVLHSKPRIPSSISSFDDSPDVSDVSTRPTPDTSLVNTPTDLDYLLAKYDMSETTLLKIRDVLVDVARAAGMMMIDADPSTDNSVTKNNSSDRVTATDKAIEDMVFARLQTTFPAIDFLGEETFKEGTMLQDHPTFVCDPIDGTLNFIHGFPSTAVSLALTVEKRPLVGVVFNPFRGELFTAIKNQGAYLTNILTGKIRRLPLRPIPAPIESLNDCLVAIEWGNQRKGPNWELRTHMAKTLMTAQQEGGAMVHSIRSNGSAALDFCYVAVGWIDLFWEGGCWIWDVCAGWIILEEAGGTVASANPGDWNPSLEGRLYLAVRGAKPEHQKKVVKELWSHMGDRRFQF